jgi:hypothetical protein
VSTRHDARSEVGGLAIDRLPECRELLVGHCRGQGEIDREVGWRKAADGHVGKHHVEREPAGPLESEFGQHRDRVCRDHDTPTADLDDPEIHAVLRSERNVFSVSAEARVDVLVEEVGVHLAVVGHAKVGTSTDKTVFIGVASASHDSGWTTDETPRWLPTAVSWTDSL